MPSYRFGQDMASRLLKGRSMRKTNSEPNRSCSVTPTKVRLLKTGQICENHGYYGNLFTLKLPNGRMAEFHRRDLDPKFLTQLPSSASVYSRWNPA